MDPGTYDKGTEVGSSFTTAWYPNKCIPAAPSGARRLQSTSTDLDATTDEPLSEGFTPSAVASDLDAPELGDDLLPKCCSLKFGSGCADRSTRTFEGIMDELVVWNRPLEPTELQHVMFKMPEYRKNREVEAPSDAQEDITSGRVMWARFNNPCMEGEQLYPSPPPPPGPLFGGRRLQQMHSPTSEARLFGISDHAGYTSGSIMPDGVTLQVTDSDDDTISWLDFRTHSKYVYNGVPWAAPILTGVDPVAAGMDGGADVTLRGLGFAKSPFLRCVVQYPDVVPGPSKDSMAIPTTSRYDFDFAPATASAGARTVLDYDTNFEGWMPSDTRHPQNAAARKAEWDAETNKDLRGGSSPRSPRAPTVRSTRRPRTRQTTTTSTSTASGK